MSRVLVVDDDAVRDLVAAVLELAGHEVVVARSGDEGIALLDDSIDLVVTDLLMSGTTGLHVLEHVRARRPGLGVVLMTGSGAPEQLAEAAPEAVVVEKPFSHAALLAAVATLLA